MHAILEAAEEVAAARGLENTSIAAIAQRAGVAVGTLYNYFPDREQLLASWLQHRRDELVPKIEAAALTGAKLPFERRLRAYLEAVMQIFDEKRRFVKVMAGMEPKAAKIKERTPPVLVTMQRTLEEMIEPVAPENYEAYAQLLLGMIRGIVHWRSAKDQPLDHDAALIADTFLKGMQRK